MGERAVFIEYYQPVFLRLTGEHPRWVRRATLDLPRALRHRYLFPHIGRNIEQVPSIAWPVFHNYLSKIEERMRALLARHSVFYWLSILRRTRPGLVTPYPNKTDAATAVLVRQIEELAIRKFASLSRTDDVQLSSNVRFEEILGGLFASITSEEFGATAAASIYDQIVKDPQWVICEFTRRDFLTISRLEGLAYEYWSTMAVLRAVGKGAGVVLRADDEWIYYVEPKQDFWRLITSYDSRNEKHGGGAETLLGTWYHDTARFSTDAIVSVYHNVHSTDVSRAIAKSMNPNFTGPFIPNFLVSHKGLEEFWKSHEFMAEPYRAVHGRPLDAMLLALWGLSNHVLYPNRVLDEMFANPEAVKLRDLMFKGVLHVLKRGYSTVERHEQSLAESIHARADMMKVSPSADANDLTQLQACLDAVTMTPATQKQISLWSSGPYLPVFIHGGAHVIDLAAIPFVLMSLFYKVQDKNGEKGTVFEMAVAAALNAEGFSVTKPGKIYNTVGQNREIDVAVRFGDVLLLLECRAAERPLDFEIGKPDTIKKRNEYLQEKVEQADTLRDFILQYPKGTNYDYSWAKEIRSFVVSPFIEWIWDTSPGLWQDGQPKVLSGDEAIAYARHLRAAAKRKERRERKQARKVASSPRPPRYRKTK